MLLKLKRERTQAGIQFIRFGNNENVIEQLDKLDNELKIKGVEKQL